MWRERMRLTEACADSVIVNKKKDAKQMYRKTKKKKHMQYM